MSESRTYNTDNTLASISFTGAAIGDLTYGWDANKNKTSESIGASDERPTHELLTVASQSVVHDAKGNMTSIPSSLRPTASSLSLKWDFENKLIAADIDNDSTDDIFYKFDALGRRIGRDDGTANVVYFQDGQQTIADYPSGTAAGSPTYTYVYASYIDEPVMRGGSGGLRYYHRNQQYSITALTDGGGSIVERYAYTAYGQVTFADASGTVQTASAGNNRHTYTGTEWDSGLHLYHYRARMHNAVAGRFVSRDPIGFNGSMWNLYEYVNSGPLQVVDPTGLSAIRDPDKPHAGIYLRCCIEGRRRRFYDYFGWQPPYCCSRPLACTADYNRNTDTNDRTSLYAGRQRLKVLLKKHRGSACVKICRIQDEHGMNFWGDPWSYGDGDILVS